MNKFLEKIAMFGFSQQEKKQKLWQDHYIAMNNHMAEYGNPLLQKLHTTHSHLSADDYNRNYLDTLSKDKNFRKVWKSKHEEFSKRYENLGMKYPHKTSDEEIDTLISDWKTEFKL